MDTRTMHLVVLLVFAGVSLVNATSNDTSSALPTNSSTAAPQNSPETSTKVTSSPQNSITIKGPTISPAAVVTQTTKSLTTPAPLNCRVGVCNGTTTADCKTVSAKLCNSGENCAVVQKKLNDTYSSYSFSCEADCNSLVKQGKAACCSQKNCTPDLSKPIDNNNGGVKAVPFNFISFLLLVLMSVLVM